MLWDYKNKTNYLHFGENPIRFGSVVTKKCGFFLKVCHTSLPSKFCIYISINHSKGVWNSVMSIHCVV